MNQEYKTNALVLKNISNHMIINQCKMYSISEVKTRTETYHSIQTLN